MWTIGVFFLCFAPFPTIFLLRWVIKTGVRLFVLAWNNPKAVLFNTLPGGWCLAAAYYVVKFVFSLSKKVKELMSLGEEK